MAQLKTGTRIYGTAAVDSTLTVGSASSTGTASQALQVTGGAYVSNSLAIGSTQLISSRNVFVAVGSTSSLYDPNNTLSSSFVNFRNKDLTAGTDFTLRIDANGDGTTAATSISAISESLGGNSALTFATRSNGGNVTEKLRISSTGNIGIGTIVAGAKLHIRSGTGTDAPGGADSHILFDLGNDAGPAWAQRLYGSIAGSGGNDGAFALDRRTGASWNNVISILRSDGSVGVGTTIPRGLIQVGAAITNSLFVSSNLGIGSVGIGTNFPGAKLEVNDFLGTPNRSPIVFLQRINNLPANQQLVENADLRIKGHISNPKLYIENQAGDPILSIASGVGTVGIGTSIANAPKLWVHHSNVGTYSSTTAPNTQGSVMIFNSDNTNTDLFSGISFGTRRSNNTAYSAIQGISLGNDVMGLAFKTQSAGPAYRESMRITGVGSVGVGTTTPTALLHLVSSGSGTGPGRAPVKIGAATTLETAEAGAIEYDGSVFYKTPAGASGRGVSPATHVYRVTAAGSNFGPASADVFPANSTLSLEPNSVYAYKIVSMLTKTTTGICTLSLLVTGGTVTNFSYATNIPAVAGSFETTGPSQVSWASSTGNTSVANIPSSNYSNNAFINHNIEGIIQTSSASVNLRLRAVQTAGSLRINVGSYMMFTKLPSTQVGVFVT